jgi:hypothetical protein
MLVCHCYICVTRVYGRQYYSILTRKTGSQVVSQADFITAFVSYTNITIPYTAELYTVQYSIYLSVSVYCLESISVFFSMLDERFQEANVHRTL